MCKAISPLPDLITATGYKGLAAKGFNGEVGPVTLKGFEFIISASPVLIKGKQKGTILVFSDFTKMRESVLQSARDRNIVTFDDIIGESEALLYAREMAIQVAEKDVAVLLMGKPAPARRYLPRQSTMPAAAK